MRWCKAFDTGAAACLCDYHRFQVACKVMKVPHTGGFHEQQTSTEVSAILSVSRYGGGATDDTRRGARPRGQRLDRRLGSESVGQSSVGTRAPVEYHGHTSHWAQQGRDPPGKRDWEFLHPARS